MTRTAVRLVLLALSVNSLVLASSRWATVFECVEDLQLPTHGALSLVARIEGKVVLSFKVDSNEQASDVEHVYVGHPLLFKQAREALQEWRFKRECAEKKVKLIFDFRIRGLPMQQPYQYHTIQPPDTLIITSTPQFVVPSHIPLEALEDDLEDDSVPSSPDRTFFECAKELTLPRTTPPLVIRASC